MFSIQTKFSSRVLSLFVFSCLLMSTQVVAALPSAVLTFVSPDSVTRSIVTNDSGYSLQYVCVKNGTVILEANAAWTFNFTCNTGPGEYNVWLEQAVIIYDSFGNANIKYLKISNTISYSIPLKFFTKTFYCNVPVVTRFMNTGTYSSNGVFAVKLIGSNGSLINHFMTVGYFTAIGTSSSIELNTSQYGGNFKVPFTDDGTIIPVSYSGPVETLAGANVTLSSSFWVTNHIPYLKLNSGKVTINGKTAFLFSQPVLCSDVFYWNWL